VRGVNNGKLMVKDYSKLITPKLINLVLLCGTTFLFGCAGTPADFSQRTTEATNRQNQLVGWLSEDVKASSSNRILAPVCSGSVGHPEQGWAIDGGNWCVVSCPVKPANNVLDRWLQTHDGLRCFATDEKATALIETEFEPQHWRLDQQQLFNGFDRSFVSDTEWACKEQEYQIDPDSQEGFWADLGTGDTYIFYDDGALMTARSGRPLKFAGDWRGKQGKGVVVNDREVFTFAVNYGGGRFDEFESATRKQVCRFVDNPGPRV